jgi:hypothetical protein
MAENSAIRESVGEIQSVGDSPQDQSKLALTLLHQEFKSLVALHQSTTRLLASRCVVC